MVKPYQLMIVPGMIFTAGGLLASACGKEPPKESFSEYKLLASASSTNHPNSPEYRGAGLEGFAYFKLPDKGVAWDRHSKDGAPPTIVGVMHAGKSGGVLEINLDLKPVDVDPCKPTPNSQDVPLFEVWAPMKTPVNLCSTIENNAPVDAPYPEPRTDCEEEHAKSYDGRAIVVPGYWDERGDYKDTVGPEHTPVFTVSCMTGASAKCAHWGYLPWLPDVQLDSRKIPMGDFYKACVFASRAEFAGKGTEDEPSYCNGNDLDTRAFTCPGTYFAIQDIAGIQEWSKEYAHKDWPKDVNEPVTALPVFESLWGADGLACRARSRFEQCEYEIKPPTCKTDVTDPVYDLGTCPATWPPTDPNVLIGVKTFDHTKARCPIHGGCDFAPPFKSL